MPTAPTLLPTQITQGAAPGLNYRLEGELVPVLHMALDGQVPVYFEHHVLLWKYPSMQVGLHPLKKGLKRRAFGGMPLLLIEAQSSGEIAFSRDAPGHIAALHLPAGAGIVVCEHQFLAATGNVQYDYSRIKGFANMLYGGGFFVDEFYAADQEGVVWVHGYGNVFEKVLEAGETIDIEPGGWVYRDHSVQMSQEVYASRPGFSAVEAAASFSIASPAPAAWGCRAPTSIPRSARVPAAMPSAAEADWATSSAACSTTEGERQ
ncbi:MAG: AIM24 family protein [Solirubrobacteraceae bacterium]